MGNAAEILPELVVRGVTPDVVTDQTSAHDPLYGYIPAGLGLEEAAELRRELDRRIEDWVRDLRGRADVRYVEGPGSPPPAASGSSWTRRRSGAP